VQNNWSVAQMRAQRWEAMGAPADLKPRPEDVIAGEQDEDVDAAVDEHVPETISDRAGEVRPADAAGDDFSDSAPSEAGRSLPSDAPETLPAVEPLRPFEALPPLPSDLNEAFEAFKLAILSHKVSGWQEISQADVLSVLESLKQLALAPADG
jgi:hypothetical protein